MDIEEVKILYNNHIHSLLGLQDRPSLIDDNDIKSEELGSQTTLYTAEKQDYEVLETAGNLKYLRIGGYFVISLTGSRPLDLTVERVRNRVKLIDDRLDIEEGTHMTMGENAYMLTFRESPESIDYYLPEKQGRIVRGIIPEGKSYLNLKQDHFVLMRDGKTGYPMSVSEELYEEVKDLLYNPDIGECKRCGVKMCELDGGYCPMCIEQLYQCGGCNKLVEYKDLSNKRDNTGRWLCKKCAEKPTCRGCGRTLSGRSHSNICSNCANAHGIYGYHSGIGRMDESDEYRLRVGIEVEKEDDKIAHSINNADLLNDTGWVAERDSSLDEYKGFELISPIYPLNIPVLKERLYNERLEPLLNAKTTDRCGGHIHISDTERTPYELLRDIKGYLPLLYSLYPKRATNAYCEAKETGDYLNEGHRQAMNITGKTLEFRIFPAVENVEQLLFRITLIKYMVDNPEKDPVNIGKKLLDENDPLYKILNRKISTDRIKRKAEAFIDFTNYIERDALVKDGKTIKRVIKTPKMKLDKEKEFNKFIDDVSTEIKRTTSGNLKPPTPRDMKELEKVFGWVYKFGKV